MDNQLEHDTKKNKIMNVVGWVFVVAFGLFALYFTYSIIASDRELNKDPEYLSWKCREDHDTAFKVEYPYHIEERVNKVDCPHSLVECGESEEYVVTHWNESRTLKAMEFVSVAVMSATEVPKTPELFEHIFIQESDRCGIWKSRNLIPCLNGTEHCTQPANIYYIQEIDSVFVEV